MTISSVLTSKGELRYAKCCSGPGTMIMAPGLSLTSVLKSASEVENAYDVFNGKYTIYLFDYPTEYPEGAEIEYNAEALAEAIRLLGLKDCCFFGVSLGGMIGQILLAQYPELFVSAVLGSTVTRLTDASRGLFLRWIEYAELGDVRSLNRSFHEVVYSETFLKKFAEPIRKALDNGTESDCLLMAIRCSMLLRSDLREYDRKITTPTLVIASEKDKVFPVEDLTEPAELIGCPIYLYDGFSHAVYDEAPDYKQRILDHFAQA